MVDLKDGGWGEIIELGRTPPFAMLGGRPTITIELLYQDFKKRLMNELIVGIKDGYPATINDMPLILSDKEKDYE